MKIKCEFCGTMMNDTLDTCPSCGAPNKNVRRSTADQPTTIAALQEWYKSHGLPPASVTRFFIGENCTEPKAFGIYREEETGNYIVYKNKASGQRVIRYQGSDEAYAVNELFQRLKQEITEQKLHQAKTGAVPAEEKKSGWLGNLGALALLVVGGIGAVLAFFVLFGLFLGRNDPQCGYYEYGSESYYYSDRDYNGLNWFSFDSGASSWYGPLELSQVPDPLETKKTGKQYLVSTDWNSSLPCSSFASSVYARDLERNARTAAGYYQADDLTWYHLGSIYDDGWYFYDDDSDEWAAASADALPEELLHPSLAEDFYFTPTWDNSTQFSDFEDTALYQEAKAQWDNHDGDSYSWNSDDSWDSGDTDWDSDW